MEVIPKIIHYCWFGYGKQSKPILNCIKSWKNSLPDYEIICWDESNTDLNNSFVKEAYHKKKWAFVSDYIRFWVLDKYGGIYLDTDMLVIENFDKILLNKCFFCFTDSNYIGAGVIGSVKKHPFIKGCLDNYNVVEFDIDKLNTFTSPKIVTNFFEQEYKLFAPYSKTVILNNITIYSVNYFYPMPYEARYEKSIEGYIKNKETLAVHLWNASWVEVPALILLRNRQYYKGMIAILREVIKNKGVSISYLKKVYYSVKISLSKN